MYAIEFQATIKNGRIEIPTQYKEQFGDNVRVILLADEEESTTESFIDQLLGTPINVMGFHPLAREEIYAR